MAAPALAPAAGAGGRLALYYETNSFVGVVPAYGGAGGSFGGAGTVFSEPAIATRGQTTIDNAGHPGGVTRLNTAFWTAGDDFDSKWPGAAQVLPDMPS